MATPTVDPTKGNVFGPTGVFNGRGGSWYDPAGIFGGGGGGMGPSGMADETLYATQDFQSIFGRAPTAVELAQALPAYVDPNNPHIPNKAGGKAFIADMFQQQENTPDKIYSRQQAQYLADAPKFKDQINNLFKSNYGRDASTDELSHFGAIMASGNQDAYQLQQFLQQQPEYQTKQNEKFQSDLSGKLAGYDETYFKNNILPSIQEAYAKQGRSFDSSAFANSATQSAEQQSADRGKYIAGLSASQYGDVEDRAYSDYANAVANANTLTNAGINAKYAGVQNTINRSNEISDYNMQNQLYNQYLAKYGKRNPVAGALQGGISGAGTGAVVGGPWGALIGGVAGAGLGAYGASQQGGSY